MEQRAIKALLEQVAAGQMEVDDALLKLKLEPFQELGFAKLDSHRGLRQGVAEVIYGAGKTPEQIAQIVDAMRAGGQDTILITRMSAEAAAYLESRAPLRYDPLSRVGIVGEKVLARYSGRILNIHPALIPSFCGKGFYGLHVHEAVLARGCKVTGATAHLVTAGVDEGPILLQKAVDVLPGDTPETLQKRVMEQAEWHLLPAATKMLAEEMEEAK